MRKRSAGENMQQFRVFEWSSWVDLSELNCRTISDLTVGEEKHNPFFLNASNLIHSFEVLSEEMI